jgi:hypothetical protein
VLEDSAGFLQRFGILRKDACGNIRAPQVRPRDGGRERRRRSPVAHRDRHRWRG